MTPTLEDVTKTLLLPIFGDESPNSIILSPYKRTIEELFYGVIKGWVVSLGCKPATFLLWSKFFFSERDNHNVPILDCRVACIAMWLSKYILVDLLCHTVKFSVFKLAIRMASGVRFPLTGMFLGTLYFHLE